MTDFVAEFRPRQHYARGAPSHYPGDGFVASFGKPSKGYLRLPSVTNPATSPNFLYPPSPYSSDSTCGWPEKTLASPSEAYSDEDVFDIVSSKQLSKSALRSVLEKSIFELAEKVLYGKSISKIKGCLTISLSDDHAPIELNLNKAYPEAQRTPLHLELEDSVRMKGSRMGRGESPESVVSDEWMGGLSHELCLRADVRQSSCSPGAYSPRTPGGDDFKKTNMLGMNFVACSASKVVNTCYQTTCQDNITKEIRQPVDKTQALNFQTPVEQEEEKIHVEKVSALREIRQNADGNQNTFDDCDEEDDSTESNLVIDIPCETQEHKSRSEDAEMMEIDSGHDAVNAEHIDSVNDKEMSTESESDDCCRTQFHSSSSDGSSDDTEDADEISAPRTKVKDTESLEEAPGDSGRSHDSSVSSHLHSLAAQHPEGMVCKYCQQTLPDHGAVVEHAQEKHGLFCCNICFKTFTAKNNLKRHVRIHTGLRPYKCAQCQQQFARRDDLKSHMLRHDYSKPFRCSLCQKGYTDKACVKNHMAKEHSCRRLIVCPQCGESFDNDDAFSSHKTSHPELQKYSCEDCPFIGTNKLMAMKHKLIHTHKLFSCKPCNAHFPDPFNYTSHIRTHKSQGRFVSYTCCFCDILLPSYEQFVRHEYSHAQGKTFSCPESSSLSNSKVLVEEHSTFHENEPVLSEMEHNSNVGEAMIQVNMDTQHNQNEKRDKPQMTIPTIVLTQSDRDDSDGTCNGVLDLSMKPPPRSAPDSTFNLEQHKRLTQDLGNSFSISSTQTCGPAKDVYTPRDGCVSGPPSVGVVEKIGTQRLPMYAGVKNTAEATYRHVYKTNENSFQSKAVDVDSEMTESNLPAFERLGCMSNCTPERPKSSEIERPGTVMSKKSLLLRSLSGQSPRYSPYKRSKIADFTSKFLAARGHEVGMFKKGGLKSSPASIARPMEEIQNFERSQNANDWSCQNVDKRHISSKAVSEDGNANVSLSPGEPTKTAGKFNSDAIPTFIKIEPLFESDHVVSTSILSDSGSNEDLLRSKKARMLASHQLSQICGQCKEEFSSFSELESHSVIDHKRYLCEHCGKSFSARPNRDRHVRYHTGERPYKCDLCDQAFFRGDDLKYHRTTRHPSAQPFMCSRCSATFTWKKDLERHIRQSRCKV